MDYNTSTIPATFIAGTNSTTVTMSLISDDIVEGPETFKLNITIPPSLSGRVTLGTITEAVGNITDDTSKILYVNHLFADLVLVTS